MNTNQTELDFTSAAKKTLRYYADIRGGDGFIIYSELATDLIADIKHLCSIENIDFDEVLRLSDLHFQSEREIESND